MVSATADPDTFVLRKSDGDVEFLTQELGEKKTSIVMSGLFDVKILSLLGKFVELLESLIASHNSE